MRPIKVAIITGQLGKGVAERELYNFLKRYSASMRALGKLGYHDAVMRGRNV